MQLLFYAIGGPDVGLGHYFRTLSLHREALRRGHSSQFVTNVTMGDIPPYTSIVKGHRLAFQAALRQKPDWAVIDLPGETPVWLESYYDLNICLIDGVGHPASSAKLVISQGFEGEYTCPDYLILRRELTELINAPRQPKGYGFVFGGSYDPLGLLKAFDEALPSQPAYLVSAGNNHGLKHHRHLKISNGDNYYQLLRGASFAVVGAGMVCWELAALRVPTYVFSRSDRHLITVQQMERRGWLKAWPAIGVPDPAELREFVCRRFEPEGPAIDGRGAERVITLLEQQFSLGRK